jgi:xanthine/uracil/vitamin C permease (AzgA family)
MLLIYLGLFTTGLVVVGFKATASRFGEFLTPFVLLVFVGLSATASLVAFLGRTAQKNREN